MKSTAVVSSFFVWYLCRLLLSAYLFWFAQSAAAVSPTQAARFPDATSTPIGGNPVVVLASLPGLPQITLNAELIAALFMGKLSALSFNALSLLRCFVACVLGQIANWADSRIQALNPSLSCRT